MRAVRGSAAARAAPTVPTATITAQSASSSPLLASRLQLARPTARVALLMMDVSGWQSRMGGGYLPSCTCANLCLPICQSLVLIHRPPSNHPACPTTGGGLIPCGDPTLAGECATGVCNAQGTECMLPPSPCAAKSCADFPWIQCGFFFFFFFFFCDTGALNSCSTLCSA